MNENAVQMPELPAIFNERIAAYQDAERGIPADMFGELSEWERSVSQEVRDSRSYRPAVDLDDKILASCHGALDKTEHLADEVRSSLQATQSSALLRDPQALHQIMKNGTARFVLAFDGGVDLERNWGTQKHVKNTHCGIIGWDKRCMSQPTLVNTGDGKRIVGHLDLRWSATVPEDGVYYVDPFQRALISGQHKVTGRGWKYSGVDARAEVNFWAFVYLNDDWLASTHSEVSSDATKSENRTKGFSKFIDVPRKIYFQASAGARLGMVVRLEAMVWANDDGMARIRIDDYGVLSNGFADYETWREQDLVVYG